MSTTITWHGHANFQIAAPECSLVVDPFFTGNPSASIGWRDIAPPDLVLVTHLHGDHAGDAVALCSRFGSLLGCAVGTADALVGQGVPAVQAINGVGFNIGGSISVKGVTVTMTEAFHTSEAGVPTGFIIILPDGFTIYHAGDTGIFANMAVWGQLYPIDLALLPMGGVFTMDARQAALAARMLNARAAVPMHWGTFPVLAQTAEHFQKELAGTAPHCRYVPMRPGQALSLPGDIGLR